MAPDRVQSPLVVLIVEDDSMLRKVARDMLESADLTVVEASNADEALRVLEARADVGALFTDVDMPGSMNGFVLANQVFERWPEIRLIITSGQHWPDNSKLPDDGQFLHKPYRMKQLISAVAHAA